MKLIELGISNFLSYGNNVTTIDLEFDKPILIVGRNYDSVVEGQLDSNGAGKTTILNALLFCLYDKNVSKIDKGDLINRDNKKNMMVYCIFESKGVFYKVVRYRKNKALGGDGVTLYRNPKEPVFEKEHDVTPDSISNTNREVEKIIGLPFDIFARIVVVSATYEPFLSLPVTSASTKANQTDIIEELFGFVEISEKADLLKVKISNNKKDLSSLKILNDQIIKERARYEDQYRTYEDKVNSWEGNRDTAISKTKNALEELRVIDLAFNRELLTEMEKVQGDVTTLSGEISILETDVKNIQNLFTKAQEWDLAQVDIRASLEADIKKLSQVDYDAIRGVVAELDTITPAVAQLENDIRRFTVSVTQKETDLAKLEREVAALSSNKCPYCEQQFAEAKDKVHTCKEKISEISSATAADTEKLDAAKRSKDKMMEKINALSESMTHDKRTLDRMEAELTLKRSQLEAAMKAENPYENMFTDEELALKETQLNEKKEKLKKLNSKLNLLKHNLTAGISSEKDIINIENEIANLQNSLTSLSTATNPYLEMLEDIKNISLDGSKSDEIESLATLIEHQEFLYKLLTKKDSFIRQALLNKHLPFLNSRIKYYLDKLGLPYSVVFTETMEAKIAQFNSVSPFPNMSSGQKARINLALSFAFRDVLQTRFGVINFCILDECLDVGLGNVGVQMATKMIKAVASENKLSMFVISHRDEISAMFEKKMVVELRNRFSNITFE